MITLRMVSFMNALLLRSRGSRMRELGAPPPPYALERRPPARLWRPADLREACDGCMDMRAPPPVLRLGPIEARLSSDARLLAWPPFIVLSVERRMAGSPRPMVLLRARLKFNSLQRLEMKLRRACACAQWPHVPVVNPDVLL